MRTLVERIFEASQAQLDAGNYKKWKIRRDGMPISIENRKGSIRSGKDEVGRIWRTKMNHHYGYFLGTVGADKDHVDVFVNPDYIENADVYLVNQVDPRTRRFDEVKVMLGFKSEADAKAAYLSNYEKGWKGLGSIITKPMQEFKKWLYNPNKTTRRAEGYVFS